MLLEKQRAEIRLGETGHNVGRLSETTSLQPVIAGYDGFMVDS